MRNACVLLCGVALAALCTVGAAGQTAHKTKSGARPPVKAPVRGVKGTNQLAGDNGRIGVTYTLGKGDSAINFTLLSAEYQPSRILLKDDYYIPTVDEKYLVLHFTLQNPVHTEYTVNSGTLSYTAVDSNNIDHDMTGNGTLLFMKEGTHENVQCPLKPGHKVAFTTALRIGADVSAPKLIVQQRSTEPVLRIYFKPGEIKTVQPPYADPNDKTGCVAVKEILAGSDVFAPLRQFDAKYVSGTYCSKLGEHEPRQGNQYFVATMTARNPLLYKATIVGYTFAYSAKTDDGTWTPSGPCDTIRAHQDTDFAQSEISPGDEVTFRVLIQVPAGAKVEKVRVSENDQVRPVVFSLK